MGGVSALAGHDPIPGYLPAGEPHMLSGASGAGKTTLVAWMLGSIGRGEPWLGHKTNRPGQMVAILGDRTARDTLEKLERAGVGEDLLRVYSLVDDLTPQGRGLVEMLDRPKVATNPFPILARAEEKTAGKSGWPAGTLVVIDGMAAILGIEPAGKFLSNVAKPLLRFSQWLLDKRATALLIHQQGKAKADAKQRWARKQDAILGSMALHAGTGTQMSLMEPETCGGDHHEFLWVPHGAPKELVQLRRGSDGRFEELAPGAVPVRLVGGQVDAHLTELNLAQGLPHDLQAYYDMLTYAGVSIMVLCSRGKERWAHARPTVYRKLDELRKAGMATTDGRGVWRKVLEGTPEQGEAMGEGAGAGEEWP